MRLSGDGPTRCWAAILASVAGPSQPTRRSQRSGCPGAVENDRRGLPRWVARGDEAERRSGMFLLTMPRRCALLARMRDAVGGAAPRGVEAPCRLAPAPIRATRRCPRPRDPLPDRCWLRRPPVHAIRSRSGRRYSTPVVQSWRTCQAAEIKDGRVKHSSGGGPHMLPAGFWPAEGGPSCRSRMADRQPQGLRAGNTRARRLARTACRASAIQGMWTRTTRDPSGAPSGMVMCSSGGRSTCASMPTVQINLFRRPGAISARPRGLPEAAPAYGAGIPKRAGRPVNADGFEFSLGEASENDVRRATPNTSGAEEHPIATL